MRFRKLRIAWSVGCGIACVLVIALWVRSYWWTDAIYCPVLLTQIRIVASHDGNICSFAIPTATIPSKLSSRGAITRSRFTSYMSPIEKLILYTGYRKRTRIDVSHWLLCVLSVTLAAVPWIRWRFTTRTLLIATTLVAGVLGLIVWLR